MSEAMAIEKLAQSLLELEDYFTETRVPYLPRYNQKGNIKDEAALGDIDVIGFSSIENKLIAIEAKAYGSVENYENWCKPYRIIDIYWIGQNLTTNIREIKIKKWNDKFKQKKKFDEIWIVIPGPFKQMQIAKKYSKKWEGTEFANKFGEKMNKYFLDKKYKYDENDYLQLINKELTSEFKVSIKVIPIHLLIETLMLKIQQDMKQRRKRYSDTALEMFRWLIRAIEHDALDLSKIQDKIKRS